MWFHYARVHKFPICGLILQEKAKHYATGLGLYDFQFSYGWHYGFKHHYDVQSHEFILHIVNNPSTDNQECTEINDEVYCTPQANPSHPD